MAKKKKSRKAFSVPDNKIKTHEDAHREIRNDILKQMAVNKRDRTAAEYKREVKRLAESHIQQTVSYMNKNKEGKKLIEVYKFNSLCQKRRSAAISEYAPIAAEKFGEKFQKTDVEEIFAQVCSFPVAANPDGMDRDNYILLACAIFILDELQSSLNLSEAILYIPSEEELISEIDLPDDFTDACYENDVIRGMMYLILHRNDSYEQKSKLVPFLNDFTAKQTNDTVLPIIYTPSRLYDGSIENKQEYKRQIKAKADKMTYRDRFNRILAYIRPVVAERAVKRFEDKMWEYLGIMYSGVDFLSEKRIETLEQALKTIEEIESIWHKSDMEREERKLAQSRKPFSPLAMPDKLGLSDSFMTGNTFGSVVPSFDFSNNNESRLMEQITERFDKIDDLEEEKNLRSYHIRIFTANMLRDDYNMDIPEEAACVKDLCREEIEAFRVSNPLETCFAYLWLIETGSNIPWLAGVSGVIVKYACKLFPWNNLDNEALWDALPEWSPSFDDDENEDEEAETNVAEPEFESDIPEDNIEIEETFYTPSYTDYYAWVEEGFRRVRKDDLLHLNFPQFIFGETHMNIPRNLNRYERQAEWFKKSGFSGKHIDFLRMYLNLSSECSDKTRFPVFSDDTENDEALEAETSAALKKTVTEKNIEISQLKKQLYKTEKDLAEEKKKSEHTEAEFEADRQELIELRELIYKIQNSAEDEAIEKQQEIEFPYNAKSRLVIFGGHESWLRVIKPMLPNVRFISPFTNPDVNLIRNADIVWMQTNAMPHSFYNKIMEIVRLNGIPVKYFAYASAEKCARQLAEFDINSQ